MKVLYVLDCLFESCGDGVIYLPALTEKEVERCDFFVYAAAQITVHHRQLIKVGEHREVSRFVYLLIHRLRLRFFCL